MEFIIPVAAILLVIVVFYWEDFALIGGLLKKLFARLRKKSQD